MPDGPFHLVLCRNLVFTYFVENLQAEILDGILERMAPEGVLVIGGHEELPDGEWPLEKAHRSHPIYRGAGDRRRPPTSDPTP
ncbi:MAG: CheR family methyltransferase [Gemmatimonadota bacterium]